MLPLLIVAQIAVTVSAPDSVAACEPAVLTVRTEGTGLASPRISLPHFGAFDLVRATAVPRTVMSNGRLVRVVDEHHYHLVTSRAGRYTIPPFEVRYGGRAVRSRPVRITVVPTRESPSLPPIVARTRLDHGRAVSFHAVTLPDTVFVGQQVTYQAAAFLGDSVQARLRRNPEFFPPDMRGMLSYDLPFVRGYLPQPGSANRCYEVPVFQRAIFPLVAGSHVIPPAQLVIALPRTFSLFGREDYHELRTDSIVLVALEPPAEGRPSGFSGAVGDLSISIQVDTSGTVRMGDPLPVSVTVSGTGNVNLLPRPLLEVEWASAVAAGERVEVAQGEIVGGNKRFDWVLTPRATGRLEFPALSYVFFDPLRREYRSTDTEPFTLSVGPGELVAAQEGSARRAAAPPLRREFRRPVRVPLHESQWFWLVLLVAPAPALLVGLIRSARRRERRRLSPALRLRAVARKGSRADAGALRSAFTAALAARTALSPDAHARHGGVARELRRAGVSPATAERVEELLARLDAAAFSPRGRSGARDARLVLELYLNVDAEALRPRAVPSTSSLPLTMMILALGAGGLILATHAAASARDNARMLFDRGVAAHDAGEYAAARRAFAAVAHGVPRSADAWANFGAVAMAVGDSSGAALGWQRALRLQPLARDVRRWMEMLPPAAREGRSLVPPVHAEPFIVAAALFWLFLWGAAAVYRYFGERPQGILASDRVARRARIVARASGAAGLILTASAVSLHTRMDASHLVVVSSDIPLRAAPALGSEHTGVTVEGEVASILESRARWLHIAVGDRQGWLELSEVRRIAMD